MISKLNFSGLNLKYYFGFILTMTEKELKARYKNAVLGFLWIFLNPILQMVIIGFIFQSIIKTPVQNYYLFLFTGLLPWNFFSYSLTKTTSCFVFERYLIQKAKFPREAIPLSIIFSNFFNFGISILFLVGFLFFNNQLYFFHSFLPFAFFLLSLVWLVLFTSGISLLTSALNTKFRDINFFVQAVSILWFYITPVMYSLEVLPKSYLTFFKFNPLAYPFELFRSAFLATTLPPTNILFFNLSISVIVFVAGVVVFKKESKNFSDWL